VEITLSLAQTGFEAHFDHGIRDNEWRFRSVPFSRQLFYVENKSFSCRKCLKKAWHTYS